MYALAIGDRAYSSWSLRGWLLFEKAGLPVTTRLYRLYSDEMAQLARDFAPARLAPSLRLPEGLVIGETLAIAETLAERHPEAGLWPADPTRRAFARYLCAEMHAGFVALRSACPMNLRVSYAPREVSPEVRADLARLEQLWSAARTMAGDGPWLFGGWSAADAFFAPVATRIATYALPVSAEAAAYVATQLADPAIRRWRAMGLADGYVQDFYKRDWALREWPGPAPLPAEACEGPSVNAACPYSGKHVGHFLRFQGKVWGFCNPMCRDKTALDPEAWPAFMAMVRAH